MHVRQGVEWALWVFTQMLIREVTSESFSLSKLQLHDLNNLGVTQTFVRGSTLVSFFTRTLAYPTYQAAAVGNIELRWLPGLGPLRIIGKNVRQGCQR